MYGAWRAAGPNWDKSEAPGERFSYKMKLIKYLRCLNVFRRGLDIWQSLQLCYDKYVENLRKSEAERLLTPGEGLCKKKKNNNHNSPHGSAV